MRIVSVNPERSKAFFGTSVIEKQYDCMDLYDECIGSMLVEEIGGETTYSYVIFNNAPDFFVDADSEETALELFKGAIREEINDRISYYEGLKKEAEKIEME